MSRKLLLLSIIWAALLSTPAQTQTGYYFTLNNQTRDHYITLYVDEGYGCAANPGDRCTTIVSGGQHNFKAISSRGPVVRRSLYVEKDWTWDIIDE
jgi:hypothetical protein